MTNPSQPTSPSTPTPAARAQEQIAAHQQRLEQRRAEASLRYLAHRLRALTKHANADCTDSAMNENGASKVRQP
jgi:hypothetical protein